MPGLKESRAQFMYKDLKYGGKDISLMAPDACIYFADTHRPSEYILNTRPLYIKDAFI